MCMCEACANEVHDLAISGEEAADLVDCRIGLHLLQLPSRVFWAGFEDMSGEISMCHCAHVHVHVVHM